MSTKFFTNSAENTLLKKFEGIFTHTDVHFFDVLVGYFYASGYFRIRPFLNDVAQIRVLVGLEVDKLVADAAKKGLEFNFNAIETREEFLSRLKEDIQQTEYSKEIEKGVLQFIDDITSGKLQIKAHPNKNIHAKIYIFRQQQEHVHAGYGAVITGSSNLTTPGLETNFEFNVELRDYDDIKFATDTFEALWAEAVEIQPQNIAELKKQTYLNDTFTPFEIYIKLLIEYFGKSIEYDPESISDMPKNYKKLAYQVDAINDGYRKLMHHNGFFLSDVVGLGKTLIATQIAKRFYYTNGFRTRILIIHPPALKTNWTRTINDFEVPNVAFCSNGSLHTIEHPENYDLVIVDEAHKFRSDTSRMFDQLQRLCKTDRKRVGADGSKSKKVILVTATPLNNHPEDIRNQLYLFQNSKQSTLEAIPNLQHFFRPLIDKYNKLKQEKDKVFIAQEVKKIYDEIRVKVLEPLIVRRTRTDIRKTKQYWDDIKSQGLTFPDIEPPRQILYQLDVQLDELYDRTFLTISNSKSGLGYYRYRALEFLPKEATKDLPQRADLISLLLANIMRVMLVKRIDSSFFAFKQSLKRYQQANKAMMTMLENNRIYIAPKLNVNEFIMDNNEEELMKFLEDTESDTVIKLFSKEDFGQEFIDGIERDQGILDELVAEWDKVERDPKLDELVRKLNTELFKPEVNDNQKLVIFSESKDTTQYLKRKLSEHGYNDVLDVDSSNISDRLKTVLANFDANYKEADSEDNYRIIITTEVLAEGVNLHRANVILNYDIPWNATRLMQRIGRVNRVGTKSPKIFIYNFFPTSKTENHIELNKKAFLKLQGFHSALGEDSQIYSTDEEYSTFGLFEKIPEEERDERLELLTWLREFREKNPEEFMRIQKLPRRARVIRKDARSRECTIAFIKNKNRDAFYYLRPDGSMEEFTFVQAAKTFFAHQTEKGYQLQDFHYDHIAQALLQFRKEEGLAVLADKASIKFGPNEKNALALLADYGRQEFAQEDERELFKAAQEAIRKGKFQKLPRELNEITRSIKKEGWKRHEVFNKVLGVLHKYPLREISVEVEQEIQIKPETMKTKPEIIISESFVA